jgi:DNA-binding NtrC family response regulator
MTHTKVLLVDDEIEFASALSERLQLRNFDVKIAVNAREALAALHSNNPDVAVLDLRMPGMDGIEILKTFKKIDPSIEVIMLTGHGDKESVEQGMESGAFEYVMKPIDIDELIAKINVAKEKRDRRKA